MGTIFAAIPTFTGTPSLRFQDLGVPPSFVHTLVGDTIWKDCWQNRHGDVSGLHWIPYKLYNITKHVFDLLCHELSSQDLEEGRKRYAAANEANAAKRGKHN